MWERYLRFELDTELADAGTDRFRSIVTEGCLKITFCKNKKV